MPSCHMPSTSLHTTTSPHLGCTSVICMQLTGKQSHAAFGISDPPRNGSRADTPQNAAGPRHPLLGSSQHRCHEAGMQTARPKCKLHHRGRGGKKSKGGRKAVSADSSSILLHAPLRQQIPCSVPSCRAVQQSWWDYKLLRSMQ